MVSYRTLKTSS